MPQDEDVQAHASRLLVNQRQHHALLTLARNSLHLLEANAPPQPAALIRQALLNVVIDRGLASPTGRLRLSELAHFLHRHFEAFPTSGEFLILRGELDSLPACWVTKILRKPRGTHHTLKYLMLGSAFGLDLSTVLNANEMPSCKPSNGSNDVLGCGRLHSRNGEPQLSSQRVYVSKKAEQIVWEDAINGVGATEIGGSRGVSAATVYRSIRAISGGPERWKKLKFTRARAARRKRFSGQYRIALAHQCQDYMWLYRNDRLWLKKHLGKIIACKEQRQSDNSFAGLDSLLAEKIILCVRSIFSRTGKPVRVCKTRIGRELDALSRFEKQLDRFPICAEVLAAVSESTDDFHRRRLDWATQELIRLKMPLTCSALYRLASIRPPVRENG